MCRQKNKKNLLKSIVLLLFLAIGIGYAYLTSNLSIAGNTQVTTNTWDIHFENLSVTTGSVTATTAASINAAGDAITYTINLNRPKEYYEFTVDVKNDGTLPGKVSISSLSGLDTTSSKIIDYTIAYTNGNPVNVGDILNAGAKKTIKVRVFYKDEIDPTDFPATDLNLTLTYTLQYIQSERDEVTIDDIIQSLKANNSSCFTKYSGDVTDRVGVTEEATNVYFDKCENKRNIIFNNSCWRMIRTTETGGIKMIYNGEPDSNGECSSSRGNHKGIVQSNYGSQDISSNYLYGSSFTYDVSTSEFTLVDTTMETWGDSTYEDILGKFTCKSESGTCTTLYEINSYESNTNAFVSYYTIDDTNYAQIGSSVYNAFVKSPAMVGYMFNKVYINSNNSKSGNSLDRTFKFGSSFTYDTDTNTYTLSGTTQDISNWSTGYNSINNTHYTCWNAEGICTTISFVHYTYYSSSITQGATYFNITDGKNINDVLNEMLWNNDVNKYNSSIKGIIDAWYKQNMSSKTDMLEDAVYCNARNTTSLGGWSPEGGTTTSGSIMKFKNYSTTKNLTCPNVIDQFAISNNKAKLTYSVGLLQVEEGLNIGGSLLVTGASWWTLSPSGFIDSARASVGRIGAGGTVATGSVYDTQGVRPVVSLATGAVISEGSGSETDPWVIE